MRLDLNRVAVTGSAFRSLIARHEAFWRRAEEDSLLRSAWVFAPSAPVRLPQPDGRVITHVDRLEPDMVDPASLIAEYETWDPAAADPSWLAERRSLMAIGLGDQLPFSQPFFKIPWLEAMLGCPITMTEGQIWVQRHRGGPAAVIRQGVHLEHDPWFQLYLEFLRQLRERVGARYPVSANTLLRGPSDLVAAVLGVREACLAWIDEPALMARLMRVCTDANLAVIEAGTQALAPFEGGYVSGYGIWASAPVVRTQADHSSLLSPETYRRQILPYDREVIRSSPFCIFHIHNNGLHIAPLLVEIPELDAVEVVVDPYPRGDRKAYELRMLRMIQEHKPLILDVNFPSFGEAQEVLAQLAPRGLCFNARFDLETYASLPPGVPGSETWILA